MEDRQFTLHCGDREYTVTVPKGVRVQYAPLNGVHSPLPQDVIIRNALDHPIGAPRIEDLVKPGQRVCIISDDITRMTPVSLILQALLPRIESAGVRREDIFIVMALGSHRYMTKEEIITKLGREIAGRYRVMNSEFENPDMLIQVGASKLGTPIRVFRPAMEADLRIGIGNVVPHGCMGWSGGAKILYPGITSADIVSEFHVMQGLRKEIILGMTESPTRLAVEEWTENIGLHYIINTVLDGELRLYQAVAGHYVKAHRKAVSYAEELCGIPIHAQPDVVLTSAYPAHLDFWQCGKAAYGPAKVIKPGGELLLLASCSEGVGPHEAMLHYMGLLNGTAALEARVQSGETGEDILTMAVGVSMGRVAEHCRITLVSDGLSAEACAQGRMYHAPEAALQATLEETLARKEDPFLLIIPEGGEAVPLLQDHV